MSPAWGVCVCVCVCRYLNDIIIVSLVIDLTCSWKEVVAILVERYCHHTISEVKCFLDPVAMVNINIYVENSRVVLEQF